MKYNWAPRQVQHPNKQSVFLTSVEWLICCTPVTNPIFVDNILTKFKGIQFLMAWSVTVKGSRKPICFLTPRNHRQQWPLQLQLLIVHVTIISHPSITTVERVTKLKFLLHKYPATDFIAGIFCYDSQLPSHTRDLFSKTLARGFRPVLCLLLKAVSIPAARVSWKRTTKITITFSIELSYQL